MSVSVFGRPLPRVRLLILGLLLALGGEHPASAQTTPLPLTVLIDQVLALFPKVEGEVIEVRGKHLTLTLGRRDGIQSGLDLALYREGRELRHPRTGQVLGRTEESLGRVSVTEVFEAYSTAMVLQGGEVRPGDKVRVSAGKIRLTLLPLASGVGEKLVEAVTHELVEGLSRTGRFQVAMGDQVAVWVTQEGIRGEDLFKGDRLRVAAERFKIEQLLALSFSMVQRKPYMEVRLFSLPRVEPLLSTALFIPSSIKPPTQGQFSTSAQGREPVQKPKEARSLLGRLLGGELETGTYSSGESSIPLREVARFGFPVLTMDVALSPHDGVPRLAITDGHRIYLYRIVNRALEAEWSYSIRTFGMVLSVQLADLDGDGQLEVIVNRHYSPIGMLSSIVSGKGGKPVAVGDEITDLLLLAVDDSGAGVKRTLWGQRYSREQFFTMGQVERYTVRNGALVSGGRVPVPETFRATGVTLSNITGKSSPRVLAFVDQHQRLRIASGSDELWRSSTPVGGGYIAAEIQGPQTLGPSPKPSTFYKMEPTPLSVDLDGDGVEEIVLPQNQTLGMLAVVFRGPAGFRLQSVNSGFEGAITGLGAVPGGEGALPVLIASVVRFTGLLKRSGETQIIMTAPE